MIVGFPGEEEADFGQTMGLMEEVGYADLFSFIYSPRPGTSAAGLSDATAREEKQRRLERLQARQKEATLDHHRRLVGTVQRVLVEGRDDSGACLFGRTAGNRGTLFEGEPGLAGRVVDVRIVAAAQTILKGEILHGA